jgi:hypothetical protein
MTNYLNLPEQERLLYTEFLIRQDINAAQLPQVHFSEKAVKKFSKNKIIAVSLMTVAFLGITCSIYYLMENWKQKRQVKSLDKKTTSHS